jgi:heterodisulfide reductase subunit A
MYDFIEYESDRTPGRLFCTSKIEPQYVASAFREGADSVMKIVLREQLEPRRLPVNPNVLIVGGGIAGIQAALTLGNAGKKVYLIEREPTIGGYMAKLDKTFPTLDCSACILTPKMSSVKTHPNITLLTYSDVAGIEGFVGNFKVQIRRKARYVKEELCIGCYECINHCTYKEPKFPDEFNAGMGKRKPIYIPFPQATPLVACIDPNTCIQFKTGKCKMTCASACPKDCIDFEQKDEIQEISVGAIILATGFEPFNPEKTPQYGYGKYPNVYTSVEVERMVNASGPTGGEIKLHDGSAPKKVAIIHCVGSRDTKTNKWCSRVCCMYSLKLAHLVHERTGAEISNFYIDMRAAGKMYEEFYDRLLKEGVQFIRGRPAEVTDWAMRPSEEGKLVVLVEDTLIGAARRVPVDMVVLSVGLQPHSDAKELRKLFNITCSDGGWFAERNAKLEPMMTFIDGIYIAGACQGPKDIPDTVAQAGAAAGAVIALIDKGYVELGPNTAFVDDRLCAGCETCVLLCPCRAISMKDGKAEVNEALCKACGLCVPACPEGAIEQHMFVDEERHRVMEGVLRNA